jgi:hypothetical protein
MECQEDDTETGRGEEGQRELFKSQIFMDNLQSTCDLLARLLGNLERKMAVHKS